MNLITKIETHFRNDRGPAKILKGKLIEIIILPYNHNHPEIFMRFLTSPKNKFIEMIGGVGSSGGGKTKYSFQDIFAEHLYKRFYDLYLDETYGFLKSSSLEYEFLTIENIDVSELQYIPIPDSIIIENIMKNDDADLLFVVTRPEIKWDYDSFKVYKFTSGRRICKEIEVKNVDRYRDGGTTIILTSEGTLYSPTSLGGVKEGVFPYWEPLGPEGQTYSGKIKMEEIRPDVNDQENKILFNRLNVETGSNWPMILKKL